jgi:hypothetical protein
MKKKIFNKVKQKLKKIAKEEFTSDSNELISKIGDTYIVFDRYQIIPKDNTFEIFETNGKLSYLVTTYSSATAISWCVATKDNDSELARNIVRCDNKIEYLLYDIAHAKQMLKTNKSDSTHGILLSRLQEYNLNHYRLKCKLHKYIQRAKYIKKSGLKNESNRTSRTRHISKIR